MSTHAASAPFGGDRPTIENRKVPLRRANVSYRSRGNIQHTTRYTELAADRFKDFWRD
jgi:hypothetical protein